MQENTNTQKYGFSGLSDETLNNQSILDVFVLQDVIDPRDADKLKRNYHTNREVETFLLRNHLVSKDTINKAYSIILKVPFISIANVKLSDEALAILPKKVAIKFGVIPFDVKNGLVRLAVSNPADLLVNYSASLEKIFQGKKLAIEIFITGQSDFNEAIKQYSKGKSAGILLNNGSLPVIQLRNYNISENFIKKIPMEFVRKYRIVVFGENAIGDYLIACQDYDSVVTKKVLDYIEKENKVKLEVYTTSAEDIDFVLSRYGGEETEQQKTVEINKDSSAAEQPAPPAAEKPKDKSEFSFSFAKLFGGGKETAPGLTIDSVSDLASETSSSNSNSASNQNGKDSNEATSDEAPASGEFDAQAIGKKLAAAPEKKTENGLDIKSIEDPEKPISTESDNIIPAEKTSTADIPKKTDSDNSMVEAKDLNFLLNKEITTEKELEAVVNEGYVPKIVAAILSYALNKKVSDIHIEPQAKVLRIRIRIDGILIDAVKMPLKLQPPITSRIKIISKLKIDETRIPQDGRFDVTLGNREIDVRVSTLPTVHGEKIVMRILDKSQKILSLEDLGMQGSGFDKTIQAIGKPWGIILSTGPTGSGKSTTLNAIINRLNTPGVNISTLEDPVEYETPGVNQTQVKPEIGFTFATGLRSLLRQDPNIIMVGEIRDGETAAMATHAALTGHLVLSTLHTNDTSGTLPRLINMGIEPFLITSSMNLIMAQRLIRKICPKCKEEIKLPQKLVDEAKRTIDAIPKNNIRDLERVPKEFKFYYGRGCDECTQGYKGRIGLFEVMTMNPEIEDLAINKRPSDEIKAAAIKSGMITMKQDGIIKALLGLTTIDEVLQATIDK